LTSDGDMDGDEQVTTNPINCYVILE
jgi:hypothetical protein